MKFLLKTPCDNCPWLTDKPFYLRRTTREEIVHCLRHDGTFPCHKTVNRSDEAYDENGAYKPTETDQHCAGALITMVRSGELLDNRVLRIGVGWKWFDPEKLKLDAPVFETLDDFVEGPE